MARKRTKIPEWRVLQLSTFEQASHRDLFPKGDCDKTLSHLQCRASTDHIVPLSKMKDRMDSISSCRRRKNRCYLMHDSC